MLFFNNALLKHTARIVILAMLFQGGLVLAPFTLNAQERTESTPPCSATYYPLFDHLGTAIILLDGNGNIVYKQHYAPFGQKDKSHSSKKPDSCNNGEENDPFPYGFTGHFGDDESGLIYMGARYYNPTIAQFLTPDDILPSPTDSLSYNKYSYTRNNPINLVDPSGNFPWIAVAIAAILGGYQALRAHTAVLTGMLWGAAQAMGAYFGGVIGVMSLAAIHSGIYGGNPIRSALIAGASFTVGYFASRAFSSIGGAIFPSSGFGQGMVNIIGSGIIGGLTSAALGGRFAEGFAYAAGAATLNYAANEVADIVTAKRWGAKQVSLEKMPRPEEIQNGPEIQAQREIVLQEQQKTGKEQIYAIFSKDGKISLKIASTKETSAMATKAYHYLSFFKEEILPMVKQGYKLIEYGHTHPLYDIYGREITAKWSADRREFEAIYAVFQTGFGANISFQQTVLREGTVFVIQAIQEPSPSFFVKMYGTLIKTP